MAVDGVLVGHHERAGDGWLTGTTVVLCPAGAVGGVDCRGGAPGTRETDLLDPRNVVDRVHAVVLTGGSAYGLAAASGVMEWLEHEGIGWPVGPAPREIVPIVPAAVIYDLGRGGDFAARPAAEFGWNACAAAGSGPPAQGNAGAGAGAVVGGLKGGIGHAAVRSGAATVEALAVVNAVGSAIDRRTGRLYGDIEGRLPTPEPAELSGLPPQRRPPLATTIGVVVTDAALGKAHCQRLAGTAHDGLARAIRPAHTMFDGDTVFALSTGTGPALGSAERFTALLAAAADAFTAAIVNAVLAAESVGEFRCYRDVFPSTARG